MVKSKLNKKTKQKQRVLVQGEMAATNLRLYGNKEAEAAIENELELNRHLEKCEAELNTAVAKAKEIEDKSFEDAKAITKTLDKLYDIHSKLYAILKHEKDDLKKAIADVELARNNAGDDPGLTLEVVFAELDMKYVHQKIKDNNFVDKLKEVSSMIRTKDTELDAIMNSREVEIAQKVMDAKLEEREAAAEAVRVAQKASNAAWKQAKDCQRRSVNGRKPKSIKTFTL